MPPKKPNQSNLLLKITMCKTINPTVTRLISVPADLHFNELHLTIAAAFGWDTTCFDWLFRLWTDSPVKYCDSMKHKGNIAVYCTANDFGFNVNPSQLGVHDEIGERLKEVGPGKYWTYDYNISRFTHALEVVQSVDDADQRGKITSFGGQGHITRRAWQFADLAGVEGVTIGAKSTWDFDMASINSRLQDVQSQYEKRVSHKGSVPKRKAPQKPKIPASTSVKKASANPVPPKVAQPCATSTSESRKRPPRTKKIPVPASLDDTTADTSITKIPPVSSLTPPQKMDKKRTLAKDTAQEQRKKAKVVKSELLPETELVE